MEYLHKWKIYDMIYVIFHILNDNFVYLMRMKHDGFSQVFTEVDPPGKVT